VRRLRVMAAEPNIELSLFGALETSRRRLGKHRQNPASDQVGAGADRSRRWEAGDVSTPNLEPLGRGPHRALARPVQGRGIADLSRPGRAGHRVSPAAVGGRRPRRCPPSFSARCAPAASTAPGWSSVTPAHQGLRNAIAWVLDARWQRCTALHQGHAARVLRVPQKTTGPSCAQQTAGTHEPRDRPALRRHRGLPQRRGVDPPLRKCSSSNKTTNRSPRAATFPSTHSATSARRAPRRQSSSTPPEPQDDRGLHHNRYLTLVVYWVFSIACFHSRRRGFSC
jgi:hypothetical protein